MRQVQLKTCAAQWHLRRMADCSVQEANRFNLCNHAAASRFLLSTAAYRFICLSIQRFTASTFVITQRLPAFLLVQRLTASTFGQYSGLPLPRLSNKQFILSCTAAICLKQSSSASISCFSHCLSESMAGPPMFTSNPFRFELMGCLLYTSDAADE